jgi:hypothetical protein
MAGFNYTTLVQRAEWLQCHTTSLLLIHNIYEGEGPPGFFVSRLRAIAPIFPPTHRPRAFSPRRASLDALLVALGCIKVQPATHDTLSHKSTTLITISGVGARAHTHTHTHIYIVCVCVCVT